MRRMKKNEGITLIALVITIIVLLILAGVSIAMLTGENGIFGKANNSSIQTKKAQYIEELKVVIIEAKTEYSIGKTEDNRSIAKVTSRGDRKSSENTSKTFTEDLCDRIPEKLNWVSKVEVEEIDEENSEYDHVIVVTSKDEYEIFVNVTDENKYAVVNEESINSIQKKCKVEFDSNGGTGSIENKEIRKGFKVTLPECTFSRQYYEFAGWSLASDGSEVTYSAGEKVKIEEDTKFYAIWTRTSVKITYDANEGEGAPSEQIKEAGTDIQLREEIPTRSGYEFIGWATSSTATEKEYSPKDIYTGNEELNLYAVWERIKYTVTYNARGAQGTIEPVTVEEGTSYTIASSTGLTTPSGYTFGGWSATSSSHNNDYAAGSSQIIESNLDLYAIWICAGNDSSCTSGSTSSCNGTRDRAYTRYCSTCSKVADSTCKASGSGHSLTYKCDVCGRVRQTCYHSPCGHGYSSSHTVYNYCSHGYSSSHSYCSAHGKVGTHYYQ